MRLVVGERARIDDSAILERKPRLAFEPSVVLDETNGELVRLALQDAGIEQRFDVGDTNRSVTCAALPGLDLDQRLEPIHPARAGAHDLDIEPSFLERLAESLRYLLGPNAERTGIAGDEDAGAHVCASFTSASTFASSSRPKTCLSSIAVGEEWHSPRQ